MKSTRDNALFKIIQSEKDKLRVEHALPWLALKSVPGIGNLLFKRLFDRFGSPEHVAVAGYESLVQVEGISDRLARAIINVKITDQVRREYDDTLRKGYRIITMADPEYPALLVEIADPPPYLYIYGRLDRPLKNIAVVGSRGATRYGIMNAKRLSSELAALGFTVVSGMARGIDTAAHIGAMVGKGRTTAVLGSGLTRVYPSENKRLFHRIAENGAVVSEFPLTAEPEAHHFPIRNRIISGMSSGVVIIEAARKSGSLITARLAAEQGREVFAVPGNIQSFKSVGTHGLIKQGAKLVECAADIIEELAPFMRMFLTADKRHRMDMADNLPPLTPDEKTLFDTLEPYPVHIDDLIRKVGMDPGKVSAILLQLELKGLAQQTTGKMFSVNADHLI